MGTPEEDYRELLPELMELYFTVPSLKMKDGYRSVTHVAHGWFMRCHRQIEAVLLLEEKGFELEAAPLRRSIIEHVVALKWLAQNGAVVANLMPRVASFDAKKRREAIRAAGWTSVDVEIFDAVIEAADGTDKSTDNQLQFKERCDRAGTPHDWATYLTETGHSHPSWETAQPYMDIVDESTMYSRPEPRDEYHVDQAGFCVIQICEALICVNHIMRGRPMNKRIKELEREARRIVVRQRRELGLPIPVGLDPDTPNRSNAESDSR